MSNAMTLEQALADLRRLSRWPEAVPVLPEILKGWADAIDTHLAQPAQAVDDAVLESLVEDSGGLWRDDVFRIHESDLMALLRKAATRALSGEAGPVGDGFEDRVMRVAAHMRMADWLDADGTLSDYDRLQTYLPASPTPGKEGEGHD